jgi:hypothetical protein
MENGKDGEDSDPEEVAQLAADKLEEMIPEIDEIAKDLPKLGAEIRNGLELLPDGEKLSIEAIQDLRKELDDLEHRIIAKSNAVGFGGGGTGGRTVYAYDLSPVLNGVDKTFNLPSFWRIISVQSSSFPNAFRPTVDFTTSGSSITFTSEISAESTLQLGQTIIITYSV